MAQINAVPFPPPSEVCVNLAELHSRQQITFSWSVIASDCPTIKYNIVSLNCGTCSTTTTHNNITCTDVPRNAGICTFALQTVVCGNIVGEMSNPVTVSLSNTSTILEAVTSDTKREQSAASNNVWSFDVWEE